MFLPLMKTLALTAAMVVAFTLSSALAQSCGGGGCGGKDKGDKKKDGSTNSTATVQVVL